jgi:hypothetical protein
MKPVNKIDIEKIWQEYSQLNVFQIKKLVDRFSKEQAALLAYLMAVDTDIFNQEERELLLYIGTAVWHIMKHEKPKLKTITEKELEIAEYKNLQMAEYFMEEPESTFDESVRLVFEGYNQRAILEFILEEILKDDEVDIRLENKGLLFLDLKTVIDCLDQ